MTACVAGLLEYCQMSYVQEAALDIGKKVYDASSYLVTACKTNDAFAQCLELISRLGQFLEAHLGTSKVFTVLRERYLSPGMGCSDQAESISSCGYWMQGEWKNDWQNGDRWLVSGLFCLHTAGWGNLAKVLGDYPLKAMSFAAQQIGQIEAVSAAVEYCLPTVEKALAFSSPVAKLTADMTLKLGGISAIIGGVAVIGKVCLAVHHAGNAENTDLGENEQATHSFSCGSKVLDLVSTGILFVPSPVAWPLSLFVGVLSLGAGIHASVLKSRMN